MLFTCSEKPRPDLILITIDTLRADHLGCYGYSRDTSPTLDSLAAEGVRVERVYAQSSTTGPSHASLMTGVHPQTAGVTSNNHQFSARQSLMDALRGSGYETAAFVSSYVVGRASKFNEEFDHFDDELTGLEAVRSMPERPASDTIRAVETWVNQRNSSRPLFLWIHLIDPHGPYDPPTGAERFVGDSIYSSETRRLEISASDFEPETIPRYQTLADRTMAADYIARYDAEIRYADDALGRLFALLRKTGRFDRSIIVVTSDHGETLLEHRHYFSHSIVAYEEDVRVPLIMRDTVDSKTLSRIDPRRTSRLIDVMPTLLHRLDIAIPDGVEGRSLLARSISNPPGIFSFGDYGHGDLARTLGTQFTLLSGSWRYVINTKDHAEELFDHSTDPTEQTNLATTNDARLSELRRTLRRFLIDHPIRGSREAEASEERERHMRSLGYVN